MSIVTVIERLFLIIYARYLGNGQTKPWFPLDPSGFLGL